MRSKSAKRTYTSARERAEKNSSSGFLSTHLQLPEGVTLFKPKTSVMLLDIIPYEITDADKNPWALKVGQLHWERTYWNHRGIGANSDSFICSRMTSKERCPICEYRSRLGKDKGDDDSKEQLIKDLSPKQRQLFNVINLKDPDKGVQLWDFSYHLFGKLLDARLRDSDEEDNWDKFFFLEDGYSLKVSFEEKSFGGNTFNEAVSIDFRTRKEQYDEDILKDVYNLDDILLETPYDKLKSILLQTEDEDDDKEEDSDDDEDEDDTPKGRSSKPAKKSKDDEEEDDEEEDEDTGDEDDEDDEKPTHRPKSKQNEEDDTEDEEDDKPAKGKSKSDDEDDDDADEEGDKPKSRSKGKAKDDDDDEEDDSDEEDEKPTKSKGKAAAKDEDDDWDDFDDDDAPKKKKK